MHKHSFSLLLPLAILLLKGTAAVSLPACTTVEFVLSLYREGTQLQPASLPERSSS